VVHVFANEVGGLVLGEQLKKSDGDGDAHARELCEQTETKHQLAPEAAEHGKLGFVLYYSTIYCFCATLPYNLIVCVDNSTGTGLSFGSDHQTSSKDTYARELRVQMESQQQKKQAERQRELQTGIFCTTVFVALFVQS